MIFLRFSLYLENRRGYELSDVNALIKIMKSIITIKK
jgi:hypothetical protein